MTARLCIGGPYAGRRIETRNDHPRFIASEPDGLSGPIAAVAGSPDNPLVARWRQVIYTLQSWSTSDGRQIEFWTPSGQTADQTMQMLLRAYEAHMGHPPETIKP